MSAPSPSVFRQTIQVCGEQNGETVFECLQSKLGMNEGFYRTLPEVLVRSFGIHVIALASYGHSMNMQGYASAGSCKAAILLLVFIVLPELAMAQLIIRIADLALRLASSKATQYQYLIAAGLGTHVTLSNTPVLLSDIDPTRLKYERNRYGLIWFARLAILLLLLVQYVGNIGIYIRITMVYSDKFQLFMVFDRQNYQLALGGAAATINSVLLSLTNVTWSFVPGSTEDSQLVNGIRSTHQRDQTFPSNLAAGHNPHDATREADGPETKRSIFERIRSLDEAFRTWLNLLFPAYLHHAIEAGMIFRILTDNAMSLLITLFGTEFRLPEPSMTPGAAEAANTMRTPPSTLLIRSKKITDRAFPTMAILIMTIHALANSKPIATYVPRAGAALGNFKKYMARGRSIFSFPLYLALLSYWVVASVSWYVAYAHIYTGVIHVLHEGDQREKLRWRMYMYKDPWYDNMYIM